MLGDKTMNNKLEFFIVNGGFKKSHIARSVGVSNDTVTRWIKGKFPPVDKAIMIARILGVTVEDIWSLNEEKRQ